MAKNVGRLAGLAALAGAAYMMSKGKDATGPAATAGEEKASKARTNAQREAVSGGRATNESSYTGTTKNTADAAKNIGFGGGDDSDKNLKRVEPKSVAVTPSAVETKSLKPVSEPSDKSIKLAPEKRDLEAGMSRGTRTPAKPVSTVSSSEEGMANYKPRRTPAAPSTAKSTVSSSEEGMKDYKTRAGSLAGAGRGSINPPTVTPQQPARDIEAGMSRGTRPPVVGGGRGTVNPAPVTPQQSRRDMEASMSRGRRQEKPGPGQAQVDTVRRLQSTSKVPSSMAGRPGYDEAGNPMRRGGAVKMASGGMTASRRADGIASRGKTRCKMY